MFCRSRVEYFQDDERRQIYVEFVKRAEKKNSHRITDGCLTYVTSRSTSAMDYFRISVTCPAPTVRPPSRIANFRPFSIAIGAISFTDRFTLSPGITISTPAGRVHS